jgi:Putative DNA-binding domain
MIWPSLGLRKKDGVPAAARRRSLVSATTALQRQEPELTFVKRLEWTEDQIASLPTGEHDYFERKSGALFDATDRNPLYDTLAKAASAFSNSGGGHLVLGVRDDGTFDGAPVVIAGRTKTRDWLEQKIPDLLDYRLGDFRVHTAIPSAPTQIPAGRELIVIDFGDSALAPHQSTRAHTYYYRSAGRSVPAPHFYLELLPQRLTSPVLDFKLSGLDYDAWEHEGTIVLRVEAKFSIENTGRVAAYKWALQFRQAMVVTERGEDYFIGGALPGASSHASSIRIDDTILPGCTLTETKIFGLRLRSPHNEKGLREELETLLQPMKLTLQLATETSPGATKELEIAAHLNADSILALLRSKGLVPP